MTPLEYVETQNGIIRMQAGVINDLFSLLGQYMAAEEQDGLPVVSRINEAARLRAGLEMDGRRGSDES